MTFLLLIERGKTIFFWAGTRKIGLDGYFTG